MIRDIASPKEDSGNRIDNCARVFPGYQDRIKRRPYATVSPGHPTAQGKAIADYQAGDELDGRRITVVDFITYEGGRTYDILPAGNTGFYWANGILLGSTLKKKVYSGL